LDGVRLAGGKIGSGIQKSQKDASTGPRELVTERIVGSFWSWKTTTIRKEMFDLRS
jgi:hypothetical protein